MTGAIVIGVPAGTMVAAAADWRATFLCVAGLAALAAIGVLAQLGDLAGSALKRSAGVKDSGWIFPGHGGLIDRTCSIVFAVTLAYYWGR